MNVSRQTHLDSIRGIAALIVVFLHYFAVFFPYTTWGEQKEYHQHYVWESVFHYFPLNLLLSGRFAVCLFFILSGYVLSYGFLGEKNHLVKILAAVIKRPIRLGGLVVFTVIIGGLLWRNGLFYNQPVSEIIHSSPYFSSVWAGGFNFKNFFEVLFLSPFKSGTIYNPPLWTISIELYGSILVFAMVFFLGRFKYRLLVYLILYFLFKESLYQGFIIGILLADLDKNYKSYYIDRVDTLSMSILFVIGLIYASTPIFLDNITFNNSLYRYLPDFYSLGGSYAMNGAALVFLSINLLQPIKDQLNKPLFRFFGHISYGLYVIHFLVIGSFSSWLYLALLNYMSSLESSLVVIVVSTPVIIAIAYVVTEYVDKPAVLLALKMGQYFQTLTKKFPLKT